MQFYMLLVFLVPVQDKILISHQVYLVVETPGGEMAIWWNGHHLLQIGISHGGMPSRGLGSESPRLCPLPTCHLFPSPPRLYLGFACYLLRSLLSHLSPPWVIIIIFLNFSKNLFPHLGNCSRWYSLCFVNSEWQSCRKEENVAIFWSHSCSPLASSTHGLNFLANGVIKPALAGKELTPLMLIGNWLLIPRQLVNDLDHF